MTWSSVPTLMSFESCSSCIEHIFFVVFHYVFVQQQNQREKNVEKSYLRNFKLITVLCIMMLLFVLT